MVYQYGFSLHVNFVQCASSACISLIVLVGADVGFCFLFVLFISFFCYLLILPFCYHSPKVSPRQTRRRSGGWAQRLCTGPDQHPGKIIMWVTVGGKGGRGVLEYKHKRTLLFIINAWNKRTLLFIIDAWNKILPFGSLEFDTHTKKGQLDNWA